MAGHAECLSHESLQSDEEASCCIEFGVRTSAEEGTVSHVMEESKALSPSFGFSIFTR